MTRRRYTVQTFPHLAGETVTVSARIPKPIADLLDEAWHRAGLKDRSTAINDALVVWVMLEEERWKTESPAVTANGSTTQTMAAP